MNTEIKNRIAKVMERVFDVKASSVSIDLKKDDFDTWDSIGHLMLIMNLESEFEIKFHTDEINKVHGVEDCVNLVKKYLDNAN
jgi:acyl carrier protein